MTDNWLEKVWEEQRAFNLKVRDARPLSYEGWMEKYLLGAISEVNEILGEMNWKVHRLGKPMNEVNLARELADLTKYVISMWDHSGYTHQDMLHYVHQKSVELEAQWVQDFEQEYEEGCPILIVDIDGTMADYRKGFVEWLENTHEEVLPKDRSSSLMMEIDLGLSYSKYVQYKEEFEGSGGYADLPIYPDVKASVEELVDLGVTCLAYTARPHQSYSRIWNDSWDWMKKMELADFFTELRIGKEQRVARACDLLEEGHPVALLEDDPDTALRAANAGVTVFLRSQPYNEGVDHDNIIPFNEIPTVVIHSFLEKQK